MEDGLGVKANSLLGEYFAVLILVLVEDGLGVFDILADCTDWHEVLILVLVEDGLGVVDLLTLNLKDMEVLILVLVEDGLGGAKITGFNKFVDMS